MTSCPLRHPLLDLAIDPRMLRSLTDETFASALHMASRFVERCLSEAESLERVPTQALVLNETGIMLARELSGFRPERGPDGLFARHPRGFVRLGCLWEWPVYAESPLRRLWPECVLWSADTDPRLAAYATIRIDNYHGGESRQRQRLAALMKDPATPVALRAQAARLLIPEDQDTEHALA